jgi:NADPH:quinone reductase-like Zn-dependent oxidoreductase
MRAVGITRPGGPDVLAVIDRPVREPGHGEVRIAVKAAAVNPTDIGLRRHGAGNLPAPWVPGMDAAGTVESVGDDVDRLRVGDQVMAVVSPVGPREARRPSCSSSLPLPWSRSRGALRSRRPRPCR